MPISFYMDEHIPKAVTLGLRMRGVDILTAQEDGKEGNSDPELLDRACTLRRVLFTFDDDLLSEATERQKAGKPFCGVVYAHPLQISIGKRISDLHVIGQAGEPQDAVILCWSRRVIKSSIVRPE